MRYVRLVCASAVAVVLLSAPQDAGAQRALVDSAASLRADISRMQEDLAVLRRDQLNYSLERDLLRETFSSNFATVQTVLALVLAIFTILSFFGYRNLGSLQKEFQSELDTFKKARGEVELHLKSVQQDQERAEKQMEALASKNQEQDKRLRGLELREKASTLIKDSNFSLALEYVIIGLEFAPEDLALLEMKADCLSKLGRTDEAIEVHQQLLERRPKASGVAQNLLEAYLLGSRVQDYRDLLSARPEALSGRPALEKYLTALLLFTEKKHSDLIAHLQHIRPSLGTEQIRKLNWNFLDVRVALASRKEDPGFAAFLTYVRILDGEISPTELDRYLPQAAQQP